MHFGRHWIRDTNHTATDQQFAASKQDNHDAEATASNSSLNHDHQKRGDVELNFRTRSRSAGEIFFSVFAEKEAYTRPISRTQESAKNES